MPRSSAHLWHLQALNAHKGEDIEAGQGRSGCVWPICCPQQEFLTEYWLWLGQLGSRCEGAASVGAGSKLRTNQYSVTEYDTPAVQGELQLPSVWFLYDMSPLTVAVSQTRRSLLHLLTRFCAVVGGVFAVTGESPPWCCHSCMLQVESACSYWLHIQLTICSQSLACTEQLGCGRKLRNAPCVQKCTPLCHHPGLLHEGGITTLYARHRAALPALLALLW